MLHQRQHIPDMAMICRKKGIKHIVVSPGSRNAPIVSAFYSIFGDDSCISIVDERSAAYFALGIASSTGQPVILICTSGTAVLNYAPALAEAYYQHVPLVAITADRPSEWIDQQENQAIQQHNIYQNYIKKSYQLPLSVLSENDLEFSHRMVSDAIDRSRTGNMGPVHINVPLTEPLYDELPLPSQNIRIIEQTRIAMDFVPSEEMINEYINAKRIMIIHGQDVPGSGVSNVLSLFEKDNRVVIMAENISNFCGNNALALSNLILSNSRNNNPGYPDLLIHSGGQVVSKSLTGFLRKMPGVTCWRIGSDDNIIDTFRKVTRVIRCNAVQVYKSLIALPVSYAGEGYRPVWTALQKNAANLRDIVLNESPFSDAHVFRSVLQGIPPETNVVLGNSSIIRYAQLFPSDKRLSYFANRGVSGIDGVISTASGIACSTGKLTLTITGDLGMNYDSNALWNKYLPPNLKIVVINNGGGGIFHILKGPSDQPGFKKLIEAHHPVNIHKLAEAFGLAYFYADDKETLTKQWNNFVLPGSTAAILEIKTDAVLSAEVFRKIMGSRNN